MENDIQKTEYPAEAAVREAAEAAEEIAEGVSREGAEAPCTAPDPAEFAASEEARAAKRRRIRRHNTVVYCISAALILLGVFIILRSETTLFTCNSADDPSATFPPIDNDAVIINIATPTPASDATNRPGMETKDPSAATPTYPPPTEAPAERLAPTAIHFNAHGVSCLVQPVGIAEDGTMETIPSHNIAGWYMYGAAPNTEGNCIIAGHNRYAGLKGSFSLLHSGLKVGDQVTLDLEDGSSRFYLVTSLATYLYDEVPDSVMDLGGDTRLTLITCLGDFDYDLQMSRSRVVAVCKPVE